jgi:hypothetical protein
MTLCIPVPDALSPGGSTTFDGLSGLIQIKTPLKTHSTVKMTLQFERKYSTQGSGALCHVSFDFFSRFFGIRLAELQIDPQLEYSIRPNPNRIFHMVLHQDNTSTIEDLQEKHLGTLWNYSRRLQDYSKISWSTFQPRDDSSILEHFQLVELGDAQGLLAKAIRTTRRHPWAHYSGGYWDRLLRGPLGLLDLGCTAPDGVERKAWRGLVLG